jgi:hydroxypyruvate isomerase
MRGFTRREVLTASIGTLGLAAIDRATVRASEPAPPSPGGRVRQSVCRWVYQDIPLPEFCRTARQLGLQAIDLLQVDEWPVVRDAGLVCSMGYPSRRQDFIATGFNDRANHALLLGELEETIPKAAQMGVPNVITMFGNRNGASDDAARAACVEGLRRIAPLAEAQGVTVCVELLNSKVDHHGYQGDHTAFGAAVMQEVDSPRVKLLYDIYHMQIMEGDVIRTIRENFHYIGHFHTGGVPGRHEIDEGQELNYPAIVRAIADLGFTGYLAHEFTPTRDRLASLREAVAVCAV